MSVFRRAVDELLGINIAQMGLFLFGFGIMLVQQKALEPEGYCRSREYGHYQAAVTLTLFVVFSTFASTLTSGYVKFHFPDAPESGLQTLSPKRRRVMRSFAAFGCFLNLAASILALTDCCFILQAKLGLYECLPAETRVGFVFTYVVLGCILAVVYVDNMWRILMAAN